ncbi:MAG: hypothetical protein VB071_05955 [Lawsonibacter sp.]|nr:hypothetical protein [Lawsonibacter sp.]
MRSSDKDCIEDLRVYPTLSAQQALDRALSVKAVCAELLYAYIDVEPVNFNRGFYTVDVRYFYRITADAFVGATRPIEVTGLAIFDKRTMLFGSEGSAKVFSSEDGIGSLTPQELLGNTLPIAVVEAVDPLILDLKLVDACGCRPCDCSVLDIPDAVASVFSEELVTNGDLHRLYATLGQFSLIRLERDTQLLMPVYDYWMPEKECPCDGGNCQEDPCELFRKVQFPVNEFFPPNSITTQRDSYQEVRAGGSF